MEEKKGGSAGDPVRTTIYQSSSHPLTDADDETEMPIFSTTSNASAIATHTIFGVSHLVSLKIMVEGTELKYYKSFELTQSATDHHRFTLMLSHDSLGVEETYQLEKAHTLLGKRLLVCFNYKNILEKPERDFIGVVTEVGFQQDHGSKGYVILRGYSPTILLDGAPHVQSFGGTHPVPLNTVVNQLLEEGYSQGGKYNYKIKSSKNFNLSYSCQYNETHYNFLARTAEAYGGQFFYDGETLHFGDLPLGEEPIKLIYGRDVENVQVKMQLRHVNRQFFGYNSSNHEKLSPGAQTQLTHIVSIARTAYDISKNTYSTPSLQIAPIKASTIEKVETKMIKEETPLLFDLTSLQKRANEIFGFSAEETLNIAQSLYEKKFITYPRTSSKYIPKDLWSEVPNLLKVLSDSSKYRNYLLKLKLTRLKNAIVNDVKVTDHHGLLTTDRLPSALQIKEESIYHLIAQRVIESVSEPCIKKQTEISLSVLNLEFTFKSSSIIELGWREVRAELSSFDEEIIMDLLDFEEKEQLRISKSKTVEKSTKPKPLYTESTLLSAMENASKEVDDKSLQSVLKDVGIGTAATRAFIIEILLKRGYIVRKQKSLCPTEKGLKVYEIVKDKLISNVLLTAKWESEFKQIEEGRIDMEIFHSKIEGYTTEITRELLSIKSSNETDHLLCPKCKKNTLQLREKVVKCLNSECNWLVFRNVCGLTLQIRDINNLIENGRTELLQGFQSKAGKKFDAYIVLKEDFLTDFKF